MYYFLSDDGYFLKGINESQFGKVNCLTLVHLGDVFPAFRPCQGDVVVISIRNPLMRSNIAKMDILTHCRVIILLPCSAFVTGPLEGKFPWLIPYRLDIERLAGYLEDARSAPYKRRSISEQNRLIIDGISAAFSISQLASTTELKEKFLYKSKKKLFTHLGLKGNNAMLTLASRDIIRLSVIH